MAENWADSEAVAWIIRWAAQAALPEVRGSMSASFKAARVK